MSLTIVGFTGVRGVPVAESGVNIKSISKRYFAEVFETLAGNTGEARALSASDQPAREITVEGETLGSTGLMAFAFGAAECALSNDTDDFGDGIGTLFMREVTVVDSRAEWESFSMILVSWPGIVVTP